MKYIFMIFSATDLRIGKMIRIVTKNRYNHCSICLKEDLGKFYSFSRVYRSNPLIGGFVTESPCRYTLSSKTGMKIVRIPLPDVSYQHVKEFISKMKDCGDEYVYNYFSAAAYPFGKKFDRKNAFTCAEFAHEVMRTAGITMPKKANIREMELALSEYPYTEGRAVDILDNPSWGEDPYLQHIAKTRQAIQIASRFRKLIVGHA